MNEKTPLHARQPAYRRPHCWVRIFYFFFLCLCGSYKAHADVILIYNLNNVDFKDGSTAEGKIIYDASKCAGGNNCDSSIVDWSVSYTGGTAGIESQTFGAGGGSFAEYNPGNDRLALFTSSDKELAFLLESPLGAAVIGLVAGPDITGTYVADLPNLLFVPMNSQDASLEISEPPTLLLLFGSVVLSFFLLARNRRMETYSAFRRGRTVAAGCRGADQVHPSYTCYT